MEGNLIELYKFLNSEQFLNLKKFGSQFLSIFGMTSVNKLFPDGVHQVEIHGKFIQ
jgi:hypothetical protein